MALRIRGDHNKFARQLFFGLPARYDRLAEWLSFGQNARWRRAMVDRVAGELPGRPPDLVLDVCSGTAGVAIQLADRTGARVVGLDLSREMLAAGREAVAANSQGQRVNLVNARAEELPFEDATFDALTFTYLLRYVKDAEATLCELARVVKPGGVVASLEFFVPERAVLRWLWWIYTRAVLPLAGYLTGGRDWFEVGRFLGPSITELYERLPLNETIEAWNKAGIEKVGARPMSLGGGLVMWGVRSGG